MIWRRWDPNWQTYMHLGKVDRLGSVFGIGAYLLLVALTLLSLLGVIEPRIELRSRGAVTTDAELLVLLVAPLPFLMGMWIWRLLKHRKQRDEVVP